MPESPPPSTNDLIQQRGQSVRDALDKDASRRATRVRKAGEHIEAGLAKGDVMEAAKSHAAKDAGQLAADMKEIQREQKIADRDFDLKPLDAEYEQGEKNAKSRDARVNGKSVVVHEKQFQRDKLDAERAEKGLGKVSDRDWERISRTTLYMNEKQRDKHDAGIQKTPEGMKMDGKIAEEGFAAMDEQIKGLTEYAAQLAQDPAKADRLKAVENQLEKLKEMKAKGQTAAIFVMDEAGKFYAKAESASHDGQDVFSGRGVDIHHSSFLAGDAVAGAGEMLVNQDGTIKEITDRSGHYKPGEEQTQQVLSEMEQRGMNLDNTKFTMDRSSDVKLDRTTGMAGEYKQGGQKVFNDRHNVADQIKAQGQQMREALDQEAEQRVGDVNQTLAENAAVQRSDLLSQIKEKGSDISAVLDRDADRRETRVRKAGEHIAAGLGKAEVIAAAKEHAGKDEAGLKDKVGALKKPNVREKLGGSLGRQQAGAGGKSNRVS
ncbi:MAG: hypothetical protein IPK22_28775 [Verrucomicrobiaceae bacterium]|nr:hypothetical protein [Verrucomicrobiaceae bacterium]